MADEIQKKKSYEGYAIRPEPWNEQVSTYMAPACGPNSPLESMEELITQKKAKLYNIYKDEKHIGSTICLLYTSDAADD